MSTHKNGRKLCGINAIEVARNAGGDSPAHAIGHGGKRVKYVHLSNDATMLSIPADASTCGQLASETHVCKSCADILRNDYAEDIKRGSIVIMRYYSKAVKNRLPPESYWTCKGDVRGDCGIRHTSEETAQKCIDRDHAGCAAQGGYSDRVPVHCVRA